MLSQICFQRGFEILEKNLFIKKNLRDIQNTTALLQNLEIGILPITYILEKRFFVAVTNFESCSF